MVHKVQRHCTPQHHSSDRSEHGRRVTLHAQERQGRRSDVGRGETGLSQLLRLRTEGCKVSLTTTGWWRGYRMNG